MEYGDIVIDRVGRDDRVARITFNRPKLLNSLSPHMMGEIEDALRALEADQTARVIILRGAGKAFSAGWDLSGPPTTSPHDPDRDYTLEDDKGRDYAYNFALGLRQGAEIQQKLFDVAKVTIVQAHGYCLAGGMELAMMADLITASEDCRFGHPGHRGIGVARNGMILPLVIGMRKAKELFYTGDSVNGLEAERLGMINYAWPAEDLESKTIELADRIANQSADFLGILKAAANTFYENMGMRQSIANVTQLDALSQHTQANYTWHDTFVEQGLKAALSQRDQDYGDYSAAKGKNA